MIVLSAACRAQTPAPPTVAPTGEASPAAAPSEPASAGPATTTMPDASVVVVGRAQIDATRDGHIGIIEVDQVLRGAAGYAVAFVSEPLPLTEGERRVFFLAPEAGSDAMRLLAVDGGLDSDPSLAATLVTEPAPTPAAVDPRYETDLATMRKHDQRDWSPAAAAAMEAAVRVFGEIAWIGRRASEVESLIGPPMSRSPQPDGGERWEYAFHIGEIGTMRSLMLGDGRVTSMLVLRTQ